MRTPTVEDPVFGELRLDAGGWRGQTQWFAGSKPVDLAIGTRDPPGDNVRKTFLSFKQRYPSLVPQIIDALYELWGPEPSATWDGHACPQTPHELFRALTLAGISINDDGIELQFEFAEESPISGVFTLKADQDSVQPVAFDD
jgi:hypothetical protein